jgi:hypothetical protein
MRIEKRSGSDERRILTGMIVNRYVLAKVAAQWNHNLFASRWANLVGGWAVDFLRRYDKAPGKAIEGLFNQWAEGHDDKDTIQLVERFLEGLSGEYEAQAEEINPEYVTDLAGRHFDRISASRLIDNVQGHLDSNDVDKASQAIEGHRRIALGLGEGIDVFQDTEALREAFGEDRKSLITYPGALGEFFSNHLERDALISFMAPEKRGKTFWLIDMAWRAVLQRHKTAFFQVGDLSQNQILRRLAIRAARRPLWPGKIHKPLSIEHEEGENGQATVTTERRRFDSFLSWQKAHKEMKRLSKARIKSKKSYLKLSVHPNSSLSVEALEGILQRWELEDWVPDVVVIDYADILAPPSYIKETREKINEVWKQLRSLSQKFHCLVLTATQSDAASYESDILKRKHFSEDKRKLAHVNGMIGINQSEDEKDEGIYRLNWVALREGDYSEKKCVHVAGCLAIGNPAICSTF